MSTMERKKINTAKYGLTLVITVVFFISGLLLGATISNSRLGELDTLQQDIRTDTLDIEVQYRLFEEEPCKEINASPLTEQLYELGLKLDFMENSLGEDNEEVLRLKEYYGLLELRQWVFIKKIIKECNQSVVPVLYFYSNKGDCPKCEEQGFILSYLRRKYPELSVYSFDINIEDGALLQVKKYFEITEAPSVVVGNNVSYGFQPLEELEEEILAFSALEP